MGGGGGVWSVGKCRCPPVAEWRPPPQPHLLSTAAELFVCSGGVGESEPGLPTASPPGGITTMTHSFIWRVCVCVWMLIDKGL